MKKFILPALALFALASCSEEDVPVDDNGRVQIQFGAGVESTITRAPVSTGTQVSAQIAGWESTEDYSAVPAWVSNISFTANPAAQTVTWDMPRYYLSNGNNTYMKAWYPADTDSNVENGIVSFVNTDGTVDAMLAAGVSGSKSTPATNLAFSHKTAQLRFHVTGTSNLEPGTTLTSIQVQNAQLPTGFNLTNDQVTASAAATVNVPGISNNEITTGSSDPFVIMVMPMDALTINVTTNKAEYRDRAVTITNPASIQGTGLAEGVAYDITLTFDRNEITLTATVAEWLEGTGTATLD